MSGPGQPSYASLAIQVREANGGWVAVRRNVWPNTADRIRKGAVKAFRPPEQYEAVAKRPENPVPGQHYAKVDVWVRLAQGEGG